MNAARLENSLDKLPSTRRVLGVAAAYWLRGFLDSDKPPKENDSWRKAYYTLSAARSEHGMGYELLCMMIFMHAELGNADLASGMLAQLGAGKNYIKNNNPFLYKIYLFLSSFTEIKYGKNRKAVKFLKQLDDFSVRKDKYTLLMMGVLYTEQGDIKRGMEYLWKSYAAGCYSMFLYAWLTYAFNKGARSTVEAFNAAYLRWALIHQIDMRRFIGDLFDSTASAFCRDPFWRERISAVYPQNSLRYICVNLMRDMNYTSAALEYYKHADALNLELPDLYHFLIKSAYHSHAEKISRQAMERYLRASDLTDMNLTAFVYHLMLTNRNLSALVQDHRESLLNFTERCLENNVKGRFYYSLYAFYIIVGTEYRMPVKFTQNAANILRAVLFTYRVRAAGADAKVIYAAEKQRQGVRIYKLSDGSALIEASDFPLSFYSLTGDERKVVDAKIKVTRLVERADIRLYTFFYNQGMRGFPLLASITRILFLRQKSDEFTLRVLTDLLACGEISEYFANQVKASLASFLYKTGRLTEALEYFADTDENTLSESYIEEILAVYLSAGDLDRVARLISRKNSSIADKTLFGALKRLSRFQKYHDVIAEPAFRLLTKSWYDKSLLDIVIKRYKGVQSDWQNLSRVLSSISVADEGLDALILEKAVYTHRMSSDIQRIFARAAGERLAGGVFTEDRVEYAFMYFCIYEIILNAFKPLYETIEILEKIYLFNKDPYLAYALSYVYLNHSVVTALSNRILADALAEQEKNGIVFPAFKTHQDKFDGNAYIEKKQPFIYRTMPGKNVFLYYRVKDGNYRKLRMRYLRFGLYARSVSVFYGETIRFYYSEEMSTGSITTPEDEVKGSNILCKGDPNDPFHIINNAAVFERIFQFGQAEDILSGYLKKPKHYNAKLMI
ncbi:MAG: DUF5717 family protein [Clostridiales bacterium]|jgi:hypothetical protein|nr:DUF5717 family protein [Clostridiales bacterium]